MKKNIRNNEVYYSLAWSQMFRYDKYTVRSKVPELAGIACFYHMKHGRYVPVLFYSCWRDGCRVGINKLLDPNFTRHGMLMEKLSSNDIYIRYTIVDTNFSDMMDIMYILIRKYRPELNEQSFGHSNRFSKVHLKEMDMGPGDVVERLPD